MDAVVYFNVTDSVLALCSVSDFRWLLDRKEKRGLKDILTSTNSSHSTQLLAATTLRNVLGTKNLTEILSEREKIAETMQSSLDSATDPWGVKVTADWRTRGHVTSTCSPLIGRQVERVEIKDVRLPLQLQRAMAAEAEAAREARAKVMNIGE